jgi:hypothetical protein
MVDQEDGKRRPPLEPLPLAVRKRMRQSALDEWHKNPGKRSRDLDLTQEERDYAARYVRWYRSLKRTTQPADTRFADCAIYQGILDPALPDFVPVSRMLRPGNPRIERWGYLVRRGFYRPRPEIFFWGNEAKGDLNAS